MKKTFIISLLIICMLIFPIICYAEEVDTLEYIPNITFKYYPEKQKELEGLPLLGCKAIYIAEPITGKVIYEKNAHEELYPASTTKILTALLVLENCKMEDTTIVSQRAISLVPEGYSNANLQVGEELTIKDLLYALLLPSANEAANVLAEHVSGSVEAFAELCNNRAKELGCEKLHFVNPNGIHETNHVCTAYDLFLVARECQKHELFNEIVKTTSYTLPSTDIYPGKRTIKTTNDLLVPGTYYYEYCTGIKTGTTTPAGQCLVASSSKDGINLISVVLGGRTNIKGLAERFYDTKELFEFTYNSYSIKEICEQGKKVASLEVGKGTKDTKLLDVVIDTDISTIVPNSLDVENLQALVDLKEDIQAPIAKNQVLGQVSYNADGLIYTTNIIANSSVEKIPYTLYMAIILGVFVFTIIIMIIVIVKSKKKRKIVVAICFILLVLEIVGLFFIYQIGYQTTLTKVNPIENVSIE